MKIKKLLTVFVIFLSMCSHALADQTEELSRGIMDFELELQWYFGNFNISGNGVAQGSAVFYSELFLDFTQYRNYNKSPWCFASEITESGEKLVTKTHLSTQSLHPRHGEPSLEMRTGSRVRIVCIPSMRFLDRSGVQTITEICNRNDNLRDFYIQTGEEFKANFLSKLENTYLASDEVISRFENISIEAYCSF